MLLGRYTCLKIEALFFMHVVALVRVVVAHFHGSKAQKANRGKFGTSLLFIIKVTSSV